MQMIIQDLQCNRCLAIYKNTATTEMSIVIDNVFLSICPQCTKEVAEIMGFTKENITKTLAGIRYADTENNRLYVIEHGEVCKKCEKPFNHDEARVRLSLASNIPAWHLDCYGK